MLATLFGTRTRQLGLVIGATIGFVFSAAAPALANHADNADEIFFYRDDGLFRFYDINDTGDVGSPIIAGNGYTSGWDAITAVDLDGDSQDEMFFYRSDGLYRFYNVRENGQIGTPIRQGDGYTTGWDAITAVDMDGDGQDEMFFYRDDGLYRFYQVRSDGSLGTPIASGTNFENGWDSITAIDLDGDRRDEMFFYRSDGKFSYNELNSNGTLGAQVAGGTGYTAGWDSIASIDLDGDGQDEIFFYRSDGLYRYYNIDEAANVGSPIRQGSGYTKNWSAITAIDLDGDLPIERVARFTTFYDCCQPRVTNIRLIAAAVDGTVVQPGETFSIDEVVGPRTAEKGYVPAPYLVNGEGQCCAVGGGVSQFGTTIHNAVFWGGYEVVDHRPHTGWISRYPLGIEATLVYSSIDYKFTNDTPVPVTIRTSSTATSVTVELWGNQGGWQMTGFHPRGARSSQISVLDSGGVDARRVSARVTGDAPGLVKIERFLTKNGVTQRNTWWWRYVS